MSDEKALLAAIWEHPHEDTPRLMYADWLDEHGQPERAEFIRVQCELAQLGEWDDSPRRSDLEKREKQLWAKNAKVWKADLPPLLQKRASFHRGFPAPPLRELPSAKFLKLTADDFAGAPLWSFHLPGNTRLLLALLACPNLLRVGTLDFRFWLELPAQWGRFASSPNVRNVSELNLSHSGGGDAGVAELAAGAAGLPNLRRLILEQCSLKTRAMEAITSSSLADELRRLDLFGNPLGDDGVLVLANSPRLARLERLDLTSCEPHRTKGRPITREAVAALCDSPHLAALKDLTIDPNSFGDEGVLMMCETQPAFRLARLRVGSTLARLGDASAEALAGWPALEHVQVLHLSYNEIGSAGASALANSPYLKKITELRLDGNPLCDDARAVAMLRARFGDAVHVE